MKDKEPQIPRHAQGKFTQIHPNSLPIYIAWMGNPDKEVFVNNGGEEPKALGVKGVCDSGGKGESTTSG